MPCWKTMKSNGVLFVFVSCVDNRVPIVIQPLQVSKLDLIEETMGRMAHVIILTQEVSTIGPNQESWNIFITEQLSMGCARTIRGPLVEEPERETLLRIQECHADEVEHIVAAPIQQCGMESPLCWLILAMPLLQRESKS